MSSLKGQLSNVEGSVKSMKVAVVVGSVLTVACLAAVFGVTVLANEVSKEVKVSNGVLATKAGSSVMTTSSSDLCSLGTLASERPLEVTMASAFALSMLVGSRANGGHALAWFGVARGSTRPPKASRGPMVDTRSLGSGWVHAAAPRPELGL